MPLDIVSDPLKTALAEKARNGEAGGARGRVIASGEGWRVIDVLCTSGPSDRVFEEMHDVSSISVVAAGTFSYRADRRANLMAPGAILLGDRGRCYACNHAHGEGDRCVSFQYAPELLESIASDSGAHSERFDAHRLPPMRETAPYAARAASLLGDATYAEELALALPAMALKQTGETRAESVSARDARRAAEAARRMEADAEAPHAIVDLARGAGLTPFRFVRAFKAALGTSPHQYLLRLRLRAAALRLEQTQEAVTSIAYDVGFADLSNFTRAFRAEFGASPRAWRKNSAR